MSSPLVRLVRLLLIVLPLAAAGCATAAGEDDTMPGGEDELELIEGNGTGPGVVYFHGMSALGFARSSLVSQAGKEHALFAPSLSDTQLQAPVASSVTSFLQDHPDAVVGGYSLGRVPVFRLMNAAADGMSRVVMIDPTFDSASTLSQDKGIGGAIARKWLDGSEERTFMLVYGDVTKELGGERSYQTALAEHPRAELCFVPGAHDRFRAADMAFALVAKSCAELRAHLAR